MHLFWFAFSATNLLNVTFGGFNMLSNMLWFFYIVDLYLEMVLL